LLVSPPPAKKRPAVAATAGRFSVLLKTPYLLLRKTLYRVNKCLWRGPYPPNDMRRQFPKDANRRRGREGLNGQNNALHERLHLKTPNP
jgi:hypothetical protein